MVKGKRLSRLKRPSPVFVLILAVFLVGWNLVISPVKMDFVTLAGSMLQILLSGTQNTMPAQLGVGFARALVVGFIDAMIVAVFVFVIASTDLAFPGLMAWLVAHEFARDSRR